jgi:hypothetical protein
LARLKDTKLFGFRVYGLGLQILSQVEFVEAAGVEPLEKIISTES